MLIFYGLIRIVHCDLITETIMENNTNKESLCLQSEKGKTSYKDITKIHGNNRKTKLLASLEVVNGMSSYVELLTVGMDVEDSKQIILLNQALDHANNAQNYLAFQKVKN